MFFWQETKSVAQMSEVEFINIVQSRSGVTVTKQCVSEDIIVTRQGALCVISREIQESELNKFYSRLVKLLQGKELGHETVDSLQRLHLILSATKYTRT